MPKYLITANYVGEGIKGLLKEGGSGRRAAIEKVVKAAGGSVEGIYYAFGDTDVYVIVDMPDNASVAGLSLTVSATGAVAAKTIVLLTPEELDEAAKKTIAYRPPGQ